MLSVAAHCAMARIFSTCDGQWGEGGASQRKGQRGKEKEGLQGQGLYMWYRYRYCGFIWQRIFFLQDCLRPA